MAERRMAVISVLLCLCLILMPCTAHAAFTSDAKEPILRDGACTLNLAYTGGGTGISNETVKLYRVADVSSMANFTLTERFAGTGLTINGIRSQSEWDVIRTTAESHILANAIAADHTAVTDRNGMARFEALKPGLYLLAAVQAERNGWSYLFDSALIALPGLNEEGLWEYQVTVTPKSEALPPVGPDGKDDPEEEIRYSVLKLWKDESSQAERPQSIEVEIFKNGVSDRIVSLTEEGNWSYTWKTKDDGADWMVVERNVPSGYVATVERRAATLILTNTWIKEHAPEEPQPDPTLPDSPKTADSPHILLYTVLMYGSGILLILLGITGKKKRV